MTSLVCASVYLTAVWCDSFTIPPQTERETLVTRICQPRAEDIRKTVLLPACLGGSYEERRKPAGRYWIFLPSHSSSMKPILFQEHLCCYVSSVCSAAEEAFSEFSEHLWHADALYLMVFMSTLSSGVVRKEGGILP